ncbi:thiamine pyrophosphokinase [Coemansia sp. RSA 1813]|nr:thiamine pyrophosphokinase [Coemansia sp. RSA 1646]KAJ1772290.1 thiamine pyrophosphokinase [Coemansia sp. RSA 1843]KAJ2093232.1 thiamine pyrophosphokinase [Coemansia sp. RSA 986]KAJ2217503.1 thiamine pyrophosphokinase [Coemansia sp. RSA 487]KAJ2573484.1 thiamine pyrophosphokinase [Coemansia sp. RSA 1813]
MTDKGVPDKHQVQLGSYLIYPDEDSTSVTSWPKNKELALLILNEPIPDEERNVLESVWSRANYRVCIDGGGNRLYDFCKHRDTLDKFVPDVIVGDLDSLQETPRTYYERQGANIHCYSDQNSTDFMKGLSYLDNELRHGKDPNDCVVVVVGGLGGRLDHIMHTLKVLFNNNLKRQICVISESNLTFVIPSGKNKILVNKRVDGPTCGILPLAGQTMLTTKGLRWNLNNHPSSFEGLMSTSNIIDDPEILIETTLPVAWTCEFTPFK